MFSLTTIAKSFSHRKDNKRILFAGPLQHKNKVGGVVVLFENLVKEVQKEHIILDTNGDNYSNDLFLLLNFIRYCFIATINNYEISLHGTARDYKYLGLVLVVFNTVTALKYNCRKFAGNFDKEFIAMSRFWKRIVIEMLTRSRANFFETKSLVRFFSIYNEQTFWLPNYRSASPYLTSEDFIGKYVFIGHIKKEKGIQQILDLSDLFPSTYSVDLYGPLIDYTVEQISRRGVRYCGVINPADVTKTLANYNALVLPTFHAGEGYPGVIIESFSVGLPVVTTKWLSLPEIVDDACGVLVEAKNSMSLLDGMLAVEKDYKRLRLGAMNQFRNFDREYVLPPYLALLGA